MKIIPSILATDYDAYKNVPFGGDGGAYSEVMSSARDATVGIYHIGGNIGVYASALAILMGAILLMINSGNTSKSAESKQYIIYVCAIVMLIAGATGIVVTVAKIIMNIE